MSTYNGWSNYETWRINLEMVDGLGLDHFAGRNRFDLADEIKEYVNEYIESESNGLALDLALSFIQNVNWQEIASHMLADYEIEAA